MRKITETPQPGPCISGRRGAPAELLNRVAGHLADWWAEALIDAKRHARMARLLESDDLLAAMALVNRLMREAYKVDRATLHRQPAPGSGLYLQPGEKKRQYWWKRI